MFKFASEVDFFKVDSFLVAVKNQKILTEKLVMLLDYSDKISETSREILSGTLYNLLGKALYVYEQLMDACKDITNREVNNFRVIAMEFFDVIRFTLTFYSDIYDKQIIDTLYPEVENKYVALLDTLLKASTDYTHVLFTKLKSPDIASDLSNITYNSIYKYIKKSPQYLYDIKNIVLKNLDFSKLTKDQKYSIKEYFNSQKTNDDIDYPTEFTDPIMCRVITDPIKLPGVHDLFFDRSSILSHIHENHENPYTREKLTMEMLNDYNKDPKVVDEINDFIKRKSEWEKKNL